MGFISALTVNFVCVFSHRKRTEVIPALEKELSVMRHDLQNAILLNNGHKDQVEDLLVANTQLSLELKRYRRHESIGDGDHDGDAPSDDLHGKSFLSFVPPSFHFNLV